MPSVVLAITRSGATAALPPSFGSHVVLIALGKVDADVGSNGESATLASVFWS